MSKARTYLLLGIWVAILPYLGFPYSWKNVLTSITGLVIITLSYVLYKEQKRKNGNTFKPDNFSENSRAEKKEKVALDEMRTREVSDSLSN